MCVIKNTIIQTNVSQKKVLKLFPSPYLFDYERRIQVWLVFGTPKWYYLTYC